MTNPRLIAPLSQNWSFLVHPGGKIVQSGPALSESGQMLIAQQQCNGHPLVIWESKVVELTIRSNALMLRLFPIYFPLISRLSSICHSYSCTETMKQTMMVPWPMVIASGSRAFARWPWGSWHAKWALMGRVSLTMAFWELTWKLKRGDFLRWDPWHPMAHGTDFCDQICDDLRSNYCIQYASRGERKRERHIRHLKQLIRIMCNCVISRKC